MLFQHQARPTSCFRVWVIPSSDQQVDSAHPSTTCPLHRLAVHSEPDEPGKKRKKLRVRVSLGAVPPLAANDTAKQPLPVAAGPRSQVVSPPNPLGSRAGLAAQGTEPPLNKPLPVPFRRVLRVIRGGGGRAGV